MDVDDFSQQVETLRSRVTGLLQKPASEMYSEQELTAEAFEELQITLEELKIASEELQATRIVVEKERQRYQELFDFAPDGYLVTDTFGTILEANLAATIHINVLKRFLIGKPLLTFIAQSDHQAFFNYLTQLQQLDRGGEWEVCLQPREKTCFDVALTVVTVRNEKGQPVALRWLMRDISQRRHLELQRQQLFANEQAARIAAQAAEKRSNFLAEASRVLVSSLDYRTTLSSVAQLAVPTLADWCIVDVVEKNLAIFTNPVIAASEPAKEALIRELQQRYPISIDADYGPAKVLRTGKPELVTKIVESSLKRKSSDEEHFSLLRQLQVKSQMVVPLLVRERKLGTILFASTQPERHYTTVDLEMAEELAQRAAFAIENAQLYQQAQEANRIKEEFLAIVSHELRTPLNSMLGWVQLIRTRKWDEATISKALETIERNAKLQRKLIEDILDVSRIVQGQIRLNIRKVGLAAVIQAAIEAVHPTSEIKNIQVEFHLDSSVGEVMGDTERLQQVVWNLLSNAVKFTPNGGRVEVYLKQVNSNAQITVSDTGKGIDADFLPYIFERFRQADSTTTRADNGLGLGLAIVHHLVEMHSGTVYAVSEGEEQGAIFTVLLPLVEPQPELLIKESEVKVDNFSVLNGLQILVVDDNADTRELIAFILEQSGAQVTAVNSVGEALEALGRLKPDVLISDIGMPDEDGYSLIRKVRAQEAEQGEKIPAVALTAFARDEEHKLALQAGFQVHVSKPIEPEELVKVVANLTKGSKQV
ncbi:PAS domain-containing hybrid sensor histidine kinase/response regulator [Nostoc sp. 'Lobaria pulmonaria (5183) cyanobiont']|uniref:PAS domain-containing hybrid sensor histidine kinase/response regulator n=1 Tax=Nostoc sp. 'Lobaria pulmonaria (5183) cyanobiont' TaxID=1618022 RepID=UPI000CF336C0|nr:ATP-binding protein [Nostoc sp. 'Lobaria pulmonaria (5183) cyanobiont']AVH69117.1 histidine kinase [Nostoc sp. 'Lobaria pulmonaria (5183) cyanobiont']